MSAKEAWRLHSLDFCSIAVGFLIARLVAKLCRIKEEKYLRFVFVQEFLIMDFLPSLLPLYSLEMIWW